MLELSTKLIACKKYLNVLKERRITMYCNNCGQEVPNNSGFCPNCGAKINPQNQTAQDAQSTEPRTIKLRCKNCNATMEVDASKHEAVCPYCGAKEKILDSDAVAVEKIKSNTYKEMEYARMEKEEKQNAKNQKEQEKKAYSKSFLSKFTIVMTFICLICAFTAFGSKHILAGIIALIQTVIFAVSWLMGKQIIGENKKAVYKALALLGCLLIIPFSLSNQTHNSDRSDTAKNDFSKITWPTSELAKLIPQPSSNIGKINLDSSNYLSIDVGNITEADFKEYAQKCSDAGFNVDYKKNDTYYIASDTNGNRLNITYDKDEIMCIQLRAADTSDDSENSEADTAVANTGTAITTDNSGSDNPATTDSGDTQNSTTDSGSVTPELKEFLDSYESFMDEYIAFMQKYNSSGDTLSMATDYAKMLAKYAEFSKKADAYNTDEMSAEDAAYYLDVMNRVNKKLADAALN